MVPIDKAMAMIEKAIKKYPKTSLLIIREELEKVYDIGLIHGRIEERERIQGRIKDLLAL